MKKLYLAMLLTTSASLNAGPPGPIGRVNSLIEAIRIDTDGFATVYFVFPLLPENIYATGACRDSDMDHALVFDSKTDSGKSILAVLLDARASDYVIAFGTGRCMVINGDTIETLHYARVE